MARKVTVTADECRAIEAVVALLGENHTNKAIGKAQATLRGLLAKVYTPPEPKVAGLSLVAVEQALTGCTKYARWIAGNPGRYLLTLQRANATPEQVGKVGRWLDGQPWMRGKWTLGSLAGKWGEWYSQAAAAPEVTRPVAGRPAGFAE